jgi:hypothetical protein
MTDWAVFAGSLAGTGLGAALSLTIQRAVGRWFARGELARDGLLDMHSLISATEELVPRLVETTNKPPANAQDLVGTPSGAGLGDPPIPLTTYLSCFDDEEVHRLFIRLFDRHALLRSITSDMQPAFGWLLANTTLESWEAPLGREHRDTLLQGRQDLLAHTRELLLYASEIAVKLAAVQDSPFRKGSVESLLRREYDLSSDDLHARAAYYRRRAVILPWRPGPWRLRTFLRPEGTLVKGHVCLELYDGGRVDCPLDKQVALHPSEVVRTILLHEAGTADLRPVSADLRLLTATSPLRPAGVALATLPTPKRLEAHEQQQREG